jgi:hypothetical protein
MTTTTRMPIPATMHKTTATITPVFPGGTLELTAVDNTKYIVYTWNHADTHTIYLMYDITTDLHYTTLPLKFNKEAI